MPWQYVQRCYVLAPLSLFPKAVELIVGGNLADQHMYHKYEMSVSRTNPLLLLGWHYCIGATIFLWGWVHQYRCHSILASLRANETMKNEHSQYKIPYGDWFEHNSYAHYLAEAPMAGQRCAGGDYYEVDHIARDLRKSRSELTDLDDGTCKLRILVDSQISSLYNFTARLLFANLHD
ncbi:hypothetical protein L7F22_051003 [Adiantum nelumboides]|nr:hypothetical protein [Adiantum nelumboides]